MPTSTITSKGQTTIPKHIREFLNLHVGDRIDFVIGKEGKVIVEPATLDVRALEGILSGSTKKTVSVEAMKAAVKRHLAGKAGFK